MPPTKSHSSGPIRASIYGGPDYHAKANDIVIAFGMIETVEAMSNLDDILATLGHVAEGVKTTKSAYDLSNKLGVDMPITAEVYRILYENKSPQQAVVDLMARALSRE